MRSAALIDSVLAASVSGEKIAGLVAAVADKGGTLYESAFGRRNISLPQRMTTDAVFRIASMTKATTAAAAMQLTEQGKLSLDRPAEEILPFLSATKCCSALIPTAFRWCDRPARKSLFATC